MTVHKCDSCKKTIKEKMVLAGYSEYTLGHNMFCENCGKPIIAFLKSVGMLKEDKKITTSAINKRK